MEPTTNRPESETTGASYLRNNWTPVLRRTCNTHACVRLSRHNTPIAVLVPAWMHSAAMRRATEVYSMYRVPSDIARAKVSELLTKVGEHAHHVIITVDGYDVAVFVPIDWARQEIDTLGGDPE